MKDNLKKNAERNPERKSGKNARENLNLFIAFAKIGVMTFGGGYAMIPMLERELCDHRGWVSEDEMLDYYAIGQCTPGIIAVNTATFVGRKRAGIIGGIVATLGMVFPSLVIITVIAAFISNFMHIGWVQDAFAGIRICVCVLVLNAVVKLFKSSVKNAFGAVLFAAVFVLSVFFDISPVLYVVISACAGIAFAAARGNLKDTGKERDGAGESGEGDEA